MSIKTIDIKDIPVNKKLISSDLDPLKLSFISYGSLCGISVGLCLSFIYLISGILLLSFIILFRIKCYITKTRSIEEVKNG